MNILSLSVLATVVLLILKVAELIHISWWLVWAPIIVGIGIWVVLVVALGWLAYQYHKTSKPKWR